MTAPAGVAPAAYEQALADVRALRSFGSYVPPAERKAPTPGPRCGTRSGYDRHLADGEYACDACKGAHARASWLLANTGSTRETKDGA